MAFTQHVKFVLNRLSLSYLLDWVIIIAFLAGGGAFSLLEPFKRDFSLTDNAISFPYRHDTISVPVLFLVAVVAPIVVIVAVCLLYVRLLVAEDAPRQSRAALWRRRLWELHAGLLGLALAITLSFFATQTIKNMFGKHRPDFLERCNPDLSQVNRYIVGGFTSEVLEGTSQRVNWQICRSKDGSGVGKSEFLDGFRSFPSGHCTVAFAGLVYLSLFLAAKFSARMPFLAPLSYDSHAGARPLERRKEAAAPPLYLLVIVLIPIAAAIYIASTRYTDNKHAGFDIIFGSLEGLVCAWLAFHWYHLPIRRGSGWAWGPRHPAAAFGVSIGVDSYATPPDYKGKGKSRDFVSERAVQGSRDSEGMEMHDLATIETAEGSYASERGLV